MLLSSRSKAWKILGVSILCIIMSCGRSTHSYSKPVTISPSGRFVAVDTFHDVLVYDLSTNRVVLGLPTQRTDSASDSDWGDELSDPSPFRVIFDESEERVAIAGKRRVEVLETRTWEVVQSFEVEFDVSELVFVTGTDELLVSGYYGTLLSVSIAASATTWKAGFSPSKLTGLCLLDEDFLVCATFGRPTIDPLEVHIVSTKSGQVIATQELKGDYAGGICLLNDGRFAVLTGYVLQPVEAWQDEVAIMCFDEERKSLSTERSWPVDDWSNIECIGHQTILGWRYARSSIETLDLETGAMCGVEIDIRPSIVFVRQGMVLVIDASDDLYEVYLATGKSRPIAQF